MRKDKLSSYQAKKEKLQKIKNILKEYKSLMINKDELFHGVWELVKDK